MIAERLLTCLLRAGAKASKIAYQCRAEKTLFSILVQEKGTLQNDWLDFKTLADVFIQQVVKSEISLECPEIKDRVFGEENNQFTNTLGETITVEVRNTEIETTHLLTKVLDGNEEAAKLFAATAHNAINPVTIDEEKRLQLTKCILDEHELGIWIDPIDATSQYVRGCEGTEYEDHNIYSFGLQCVTVLIGVYNIFTGLPVMGVIYQPFHEKVENIWQSKCYWGLCCNGVRVNNVDNIYQENIASRSSDQTLLVVASSGDKELCDVIDQQSSFKLFAAGGAGYKCLCVIKGLVDAYLYSANACYNWDTCAPHAILLSLGGGMTSFKEVLKSSGGVLNDSQILYHKSNSEGSAWAHVGGTVAYTNDEKSVRCLAEVHRLNHLFL